MLCKTGLFNHEYFKKHLANELARANRFDRPISVVLADLDLLRNINNTYGHLAGDEVLIGIANTLKQNVRDYDIVCRFGGEEFAILLPETSLSQAYERAELLRKSIEKLEFTIQTSVTPIHATMSFGVAHRENFSQTADEITHNADLALYHSKLSGRNRSFAYANDAYMDFMPSTEDIHPPQKPVFASPNETVKPVSVRPIGDNIPAPTMSKPETSEANVDVDISDTGNENKKSRRPNHAVGFFIGGVFLISILSFTAILQWVPYTPDNRQFDWIGLIIISILIVLSEVFSIDLYVRQTSVSTSAIPILVSYLIFGPMGAAWASLVVAVSLLIKYRSRFNRFLFNFGNHLLSGTFILTLVLISGKDFLELSSLYQIAISLAGAVTLYLITTWMVAIGMSLDLGHSALQIWKEQFSWLSLYYVGIGFIAYAMIFGYLHNHIAGLLLMVIPMVLLRVSQKQYIDRTRQIVTELREKNQILEKKSEEINGINEGLLLTLSEIIDLRDPYVRGHSKQVSNYATQIAEKLELNHNQVSLIRKAGLLHDIGKLGVPMEILIKPGKLTHEEYEIIKEHASLGGDLIKNSPSLRALVPIIRHHHEYYNGMGYPDNLKGNQISIEARIVSVADAIEAMISDRPYRKSLTINQVIDELNRNSGSQFDPLVVESAIKVLKALSTGEKEVTARTDTQLRISQKFSQLAS